MSKDRYPVIGEIFETEGDNKGRFKDTEVARALASNINKEYDEHKVLEAGGSTRKRESLDRQIDGKIRRELTHLAVAGEHPTFNPDERSHWMAASMGAKLSDSMTPSGTESFQHAEELRAFAKTAGGFHEVYDGLKAETKEE